MTERLAMLFHEEASTIEVPRPPADAVLARGQGLRRKRRTVTAVVGAVAAVVLVGTTLTVAATLRGDSQVEPADLPQDAAYQQLGAWARGDEVHVGTSVAVVPAARSLHYTSLGALVLSSTDDAARFSGTTLVTPDGTTRELDFSGIAGGTVTDPETPYVAYGDVIDADSWELVVVDIEGGEELYRSDPITVGRFGSVTLTNLSGDVVTYLDRNKSPAAVNWRTGADVPLPTRGFYSIYTAGGETYVVGDEAGWVVLDREDEEVLLEVPYGQDGRYDESSISPDGEWLSISMPDGMRVYEIATGKHVDFRDDRDVSDYGWTPDGHLVGKRYPSAESEVEVCDPATGDCASLGQTIRAKLTLVHGVAGTAAGG